MKKIIPLIAIIIAVILIIFACSSGDDDYDPVNINDVVKVEADENGDNYATFEASEAQATDLDVLNDWYAEYYKPARDDGSITYMVVPYSDNDGYCTFFTGVNAYTKCKLKNGIADISTAEKHYRTGSHDGLLSEIE